MKRFLLCIFTAIFMTIFSASNAFAAGNAIDSARNGIIRLVVVDENGKIISYGTGFAVGVSGNPAQIFITNNHIVAANPKGVLIVLDNIGKSETIIKANVLGSLESPDIAILAVDTPIEGRTPLPMLSANYVKTNEPVYALGFPSLSEYKDNKGSILPSTVNDVTIKEGKIGKTDIVKDDIHYYETDVTINDGNSGGPLVNSKGYVIGINTLSAKGISGVIYIDYIMSIFDKSKMPYTKGGDANPPSSGTPSSGTEPAQKKSGTSPLKINLDKNTMIIIAVVVIGLLVVVYKKKRNTEFPSVDAGSTGALSNPIDYSHGPRQLLCTHGPFAPNTFPINGSICIGRDPKRCQIIFPPSTPGISSLHCEIRAEGEQIYLIDRGSSYGTYLQSGIKLTPNQSYALHTGDTFYLANHKNQFKLI